MKSIQRVFFTGLSIMVGSSCMAAQSDGGFQFGISLSSIAYEEPSVMKEEGELMGFVGRFESHNNGSFGAIEGSYTSGSMDYNSPESGTMSGIPDVIFEVRGLFGSDIPLSSGYRITPYLGLGYRNLNDDSSYMLTSNNQIGYEREQTYIYMPIGIEFKPQAGIGWQIGGRIEYDYFISGENHSYTGYISGYEDVSFTQDEGKGFRASLDITKQISSDGRALTIQPFYKYWHIADSSYTYSSGSWWVEPDNNSKEMGVALLLSF